MTGAAQQTARLLVTGADGLIGTSAARALRRVGYDVVSTAAPTKATVVSTCTADQLTYADICDREALRSQVDGCDIVIHLAGPSSVAASFQAPSDYARTHIVGTATLLELCRIARVRRFVYISSAEVYGRPTRNPVTEDATLTPLSPYGAIKVGAEELVRTLCLAEGIEAVILRPFSVFGPRSPRRSVLGAILEQALSGRQIRLQNLEVIRDYCFVEDVAQAVIAACQVRLPDRLHIFNVATGQGTSVMTLAKTVLEVLGSDLLITTKDGADRPQALDIPTLIGDPNWAGLGLNWRPKFDLREGLAATVAAWCKDLP